MPHPTITALAVALEPLARTACTACTACTVDGANIIIPARSHGEAIKLLADARGALLIHEDYLRTASTSGTTEALAELLWRADALRVGQPRRVPWSEAGFAAQDHWRFLAVHVMQSGLVVPANML